MIKNQRKRNRLDDYNYSQPGYFFVTVCTKGGEEVLGEVLNENVLYSRIGGIVAECWEEIPEHFLNVRLDEYIIMPNHVHGIIEIINHDAVGVGNRHACSLHDKPSTKRQYQLLPVVIGSFKSAVTKRSRLINKSFAWQKSYYDRIIRNANELHRIREYIINNPVNWENDRNNIKNDYTWIKKEIHSILRN